MSVQNSVQDATADTAWINYWDRGNYSSTITKHGTWSKNSGWSYNWSLICKSTEPFTNLVGLNFNPTNIGISLNNYDMFLFVLGHGDTNTNTFFKKYSLWELKHMINILTKSFKKSKYYTSSYNKYRTLTDPDLEFSMIPDLYFNEDNGIIYVYDEQCYINSIWGLKF